ncbi:hypothetical protein MferCBS31731_000144 [Microsporum ferrugineum]
MPFTDRELQVLAITERVSSAISFVGCMFVVLTFMASCRFRTPVNRLIFFATWGNILGICATATSRSGIIAGEDTALCQWQAVFIQWFHVADAFWAFSMACNVYLTLFHRYSTAELRKIEWKYICICYVLPSIPALTFLFIKNNERGKVYGGATVSTTLEPQWSILRVAGVYGPIWSIIAVTLGIYIYSAKFILASRRDIKRLRNISLTLTSTVDSTLPGAADVSSYMDHDTHPGLQQHIQQDPQQREQQAHHLDNWAGPEHRQEYLGDDIEPAYFPPSTPRHTTHGPESEGVEDTINVEHAAGHDSFQIRPNRRRSLPGEGYRMYKSSWERQSATWAYSKFAILFFCSLLVTWVPASINRVYSFAHPEEPNRVLTYLASLVLPLQGFWNTLVYTAVSSSVIASYIKSFRENPRLLYQCFDFGRLYGFISRHFRPQA